MGYSVNVSKADQNKDGSIKLGWDKKPSQQSINATLLMYMECHQAIKEIKQPKIPTGTQLKLEL